MNTPPKAPLLLQPLHGVELVFNSGTEGGHKPSQNLPFHLNVTINYDTDVVSTSLPIWTMLDEGSRYSSLIELYKDDNEHRLAVQCEGQGSFTFDHTNMSINWQSVGTGFEHYLQSLGLAAWLELQGVPCIHANAINLDDSAALIIAPSRTGKSTLTTHLTSHTFKLMTDDMAAIHSADDGTFTIYPSWPKVRLWPDMADSLIGMKVDENEKVDIDVPEGTKGNGKAIVAAPQIKHVHQNFAKFEIEFNTIQDIWGKQPAQLKAIYYLDRLNKTATATCEIKRLSASHALMILLQNSMLADGYISMGIEVARLTQLAKILESIPLFKISYRSGLNNLDKVATELKKHMNSLPS